MHDEIFLNSEIMKYINCMIYTLIGCRNHGLYLGNENGEKSMKIYYEYHIEKGNVTRGIRFCRLWLNCRGLNFSILHK